jgi:hypothetical protein
MLVGYDKVPEEVALATAKLVVADFVEARAQIDVVAGESVFFKPDALRRSAFKTLEKYKI